MRMVWAIVAALFALSLLSPQFASAKDLGAMSLEEISALQSRLTDAGCYKGPIDGHASTALEAAKKACPDQEPVLRIETSMHVALIHRIGVDGRCKIAATGADDKTVRLWSMPDGRLIRTQRLPIGAGNGGKIYAVAVSPDGRLVAAGGRDAWYDLNKSHSVTIFDTATGTNLRRIGAFENVIGHLAFSNDGTKLAVALVGGQGIRVLDVASGRELMADKDFTADSYGVAFGPDGSLYATGYDGFLRLYGPDLKRKAKIAALGGKQLYDVAVDPSGRRLAVGYDDKVAVDILDAQGLNRLAVADTNGIENGHLVVIAWTKDGSRIVGGGRVQKRFDGVWHRFLRSWSADGRQVGTDAPVSDDTITSLAPCGDRIAFAAGDPRFGLWRTDGTALTLQKGRSFVARGKRGPAFTVSADATKLRFGLGLGDATPVVFDLNAGTLRDAPSPIAGFIEPRVTGLAVTDWENNTAPLFKGKPIELKSNETSRSLAQRADQSGFVLGAEYYLRAFASDAKERWQRPGPGIAWGVNLSADGRIIVAAYGDGTIRWHRWSDGSELLALFVDAQNRRWVAWTPTGYYMASPGGEDLIGWHVNRGWEQPADFFPASRFRDRFNRPDIVQAVLETLDEGAAVKKANEAAHKKPETDQAIVTQLPPVVSIVGPAEARRFSGAEVTIEYTIRSPSGLAVDSVDVLIDGRPAAESRGLGRKDVPAGEALRQIKVQVPPRDVEVALIARAGALASEPARIHFIYSGVPAIASVLKPKLYVLAVGVADYVDPNLRLGLAAKDAIDFSTAMKAQEGGLYGSVVVKQLIDREATHDNILEGLEWLEKQVTSRDLGIVFMAGHGLVDDGGRFWYLAADATAEKLRTRGVPQDEIRATLARLAGKAVLFLDACHAAGVTKETTRGEVDINGIVNDFAASENGVVVFGSSTGRELSLEDKAWGNGAFTKALVEGLTGQADLLHKGGITLSELDAYLAERVKELTQGRQHPVMAKPATITDFAIAVAKK